MLNFFGRLDANYKIYKIFVQASESLVKKKRTLLIIKAGSEIDRQEAILRFELRILDLQSTALPLGHIATIYIVIVAYLQNSAK